MFFALLTTDGSPIHEYGNGVDNNEDTIDNHHHLNLVSLSLTLPARYFINPKVKTDKYLETEGPRNRGARGAWRRGGVGAHSRRKTNHTHWKNLHRATSPGKNKKKKSLAQEVRQKSDISEHRSKG